MHCCDFSLFIILHPIQALRLTECFEKEKKPQLIHAFVCFFIRQIKFPLLKALLGLSSAAYYTVPLLLLARCFPSRGSQYTPQAAKVLGLLNDGVGDGDTTYCVIYRGIRRDKLFQQQYLKGRLSFVRMKNLGECF